MSLLSALRLVPAALALVLPLCAAQAQEGQVPTEQLTVRPPDGWKQAFQIRQGTTEIVEFIPPDQTIEAWRDMLVVQTLFTLKSMQPDLYLGSTIPSQMAQTCAEPRYGEVQKGKPNGYNAAFQIVECPLNKTTGKGEISMFFVIQGDANTYALQRAWQTAPFPNNHHSIPKEALDRAVTHLRSITLCDPANPAHPCR